MGELFRRNEEHDEKDCLVDCGGYDYDDEHDDDSFDEKLNEWYT